MPRYFFNVFDGRSVSDSVGTDLPDPLHARREAVRMAGCILDDDAHQIAQDGNWHMEVRDEDGVLLSRLVFTVTASPIASTGH
jgi:hypothetical protein